MALDATRWKDAIIAGVNTAGVANAIAAAELAAYNAAPAGAKPTGSANIKTMLDVLVPAIAEAVATAAFGEITVNGEVTTTIQPTDLGLQVSTAVGLPTGAPAVPVPIGGAGSSSIA